MSAFLRWFPRLVMGSFSLALLILCLRSNPAKLSEGRFFSDEATYYAMTWSLVSDYDLEYTATDLVRIKREYPEGPSGIFLKRASGGFRFEASPPWLRRGPPQEKRLYFGKAMTYPVVAAPFVAAFGTRGFLIFNALCLIVAWLCVFSEVRRRATDMTAMFASAALVLATIAPIYVFWIQPEVMNLALAALALSAWRFERPVLSAVLFGLAGYTKPTHLLMAAPLGLAPLFATSLSAGRRLMEAARRGAIMIACTAAGFGANTLVTGEWNYQGGERKTFGSEFPFDRGGHKDVTFGNSGEWMTTMKLGPLEEGQEETRGAGIAQSPAELRSMFLANLADFWVGRYAGMLPYYAPALLALVFFFLLGPREKEGWFAIAALLLFYIVSIKIIPGPSNWYGGGGTVGNRYFTSVLPLAMLFLPKGREFLVTVLGTAVSALFLFPAWLQPVEYSLTPSRLASPSEGPLAYLPAERAMLNDLSFCTDAWRKKQPYDDVEGDPPIHRPGSRHGYWLYFPDDGSFGRETIPGMFLPDGEPMEGFRVKRGSRTEVLLRANEPVDWIDVTLIGMRAGDDIEISAGGNPERALVPAAGSVRLRVLPGPYVMYYDSFVYSILAQSRGVVITQSPESGQTEHALVRLALHVSPRPVPTR
jgi:hypothetical protein